MLYGPYSDKTFIRNVLTYELGRQLGNYQPRTQYVELFIDDGYQGIYVLTEKIKRGKQRVDIAKLDGASTDLSGGYMFRREFKPAKPYWSSAIKTAWYYHYPRAEVISEPQRTYLRNFIDEFEAAMMAVEPSTSIAELSRWVDAPVLIDYVIVQELSCNVDSYKKSFYASKRSDAAGGQVVVGPLWDFNVAWGNIDYNDAYSTAGLILPSFGPLLEGTDIYPPWWEKLLANSAFTAQLRCRWNEVRQGVLSDAAMNQVIDDQVRLLQPVRQRDDNRWHTIGQYLWPNYTVESTWQDEVTRLRNWASARAAWLDQNMPGTCP